ncbi:MAG: lysine-2,3-aminomutase-like protein [Methylocystaceae bacterium]|nr:MAG: lysine-2,3-aminomutase-like protein [Methylocystaceae bacterium]
MNEDSARHCEERSDEAIQEPSRDSGLLRFARNDEKAMTTPSGPAPKTLRSVADLAAVGLTDPDRAAALEAVEERYSVAMTPEIAALIDPADPDDPIARQFLPDERELETRPEELADPIGDNAFSPTEGLVHRYPDRVLLKLLSVCPVYCRFCFRRETVGLGKGAGLSEEALDKALTYIAERPQIFEVILTGGDPLALSARRLRTVAERLAAIEHVAVLRVHTRAPTAAPRLVTPERLDAMKASGKAVYMVLHVNHARELSPDARAAVTAIQNAGVSTLSQTVLLAGVNDDADTLERLMRSLVAARITPYYLHHPDLAPGTGHFRIPLDEGRRLYAELARRLSGIALPSYVLDIPGGYGKVPLQQSHLERDGNGGWRVIDRSGCAHSYADEGRATAERA